MLASLGFATLAIFMLCVIRKWMTAFVAIIVIPALVLLVLGQGAQLGEMIAVGIKTVAPTAVLLLFAVLYFGLMMDARLFDPLSRLIIRVSKGDPVNICVGTAVLACLVALDGDGTTSYMIICSAFLPIYKRLHINPLIIATVATMALGTVSGTTPWGGAATRAISILHLDASEYFTAMLGPMVLSCVFVCLIAYVLGRKARKAIDPKHIAEVSAQIMAESCHVEHATNWRTVFNAALTVLLLVCLVLGIANLMVLFIAGFIIALLVNVPRASEQGAVIQRHAASAVPVVMLVLGAGVFTGILTQTGMTTAMAEAFVGGLPEQLGSLIPLATALISIPLSFFMANDAYFFGIVPVLAEMAGRYGIPPMDIARAAVIGQMAHSIGPASAPLWALLGIIKADLGDFQKFAWKWVLLASLAYLAFAVLTGAISVIV